jgi:diguanylate cyclase (GGDEF)-like protein
MIWMPDALAAISAVPPTKEQEKTDSSTSDTRSQLLQLQALVTVVLSYQLLFSSETLLTGDAQRVTILVLMLLCGGLIVLPDHLVLAHWFPAGLALADTVITTVLVYLSGNASSELYLTYFVILLIATTAQTRRQLLGFITVVCTIYGIVLVRQFLESGKVSETQLLRLPLFMIMAIFYGDTAERVRTLTEFDALTGLPNRRFFMRRLSDAVTRVSRAGGGLSILSLDVDGFKLINDTFGPEVGDQLLKATAARIQEVVPPPVTVARLGSDEFGIIVEENLSPEVLRELAQRLLLAIGPQVQIEDREMFVSASMGIALYPADADGPKMLIRSADAAMHRAKEQGKNTFEFYAAEMNARASERLILETNLRKALDRKELVVYYQPQVDLITGHITGLEALLRWFHPKLGLVLPMRFISLAEETGLIVSIGEWVLRTACQQTRAWQDRGFRDLSVTVNLSARQLKQAGLVQRVGEVLDETGLKPQSLVLELTENSIMQDVEAMIDRLSELKALGIRLSIDDFGTGYSSLSYLKRFPVDILKVDQALTRDIASSQDAVAIVGAVITMAQRLRLRVVAEGVETQAQLTCLRDQGCHESQGYAFSQPLPADDMEQLLREWTAVSPLSEIAARLHPDSR